jgi:hypothetical protein
MADAPEPFSWSKWFAGFFNGVSWAKEIKTTLIIVGFFIAGSFIYHLFVREPQNVNKPRVIVTPFAHVGSIDQTSTQVSMNEKSWEASIFGGGFTYDSKLGMFGGGSLKRKF